MLGEVLRRLIVVDSVTVLDVTAEGAVVVSGSHAGLYPAHLLAARGVASAVLNDASVGIDRAGILGLEHLDAWAIPACAVAHDSARIGDGADAVRRGTISHLNAAAARAGCAVGQSCREATEHLRRVAGPDATQARTRPGRIAPEGRHLLIAGQPSVWAVDSASLLREADIGQVLVTGSHGALLGGRGGTAVKVPVAAVLFNDAGVGIDGAGTTRLPALDAQAIAGATVSAASARIGDGLSTYNDGILSAINRHAAGRGAEIGMSAKHFVNLLVPRESRSSP
jgi:hypothetical protein